MSPLPCSADSRHGSSAVRSGSDGRSFVRDGLRFDFSPSFELLTFVSRLVAHADTHTHTHNEATTQGFMGLMPDCPRSTLVGGLPRGSFPSDFHWVTLVTTPGFQTVLTSPLAPLLPPTLSVRGGP